MEKIKQSISEQHPPVKLYKEDIIELSKLLEENDFEDIYIVLDKYKYSTEEILKMEHKIFDSINIESHNPFLFSIETNYSGMRIYAGSDEAKAVGLVQSALKILHSKKRVLLTMITKTWFFVLVHLLLYVLIVELVIFFAKKEYLNKDFINDNLGTLLFSLYFLVLFLSFPLSFIKSKNLIIIDSKKNHPGFWLRNRDLLIVGLFTTILGTIIGTVLGFWLASL